MYPPHRKYTPFTFKQVKGNKKPVLGPQKTLLTHPLAWIMASGRCGVVAAEFDAGLHGRLLERQWGKTDRGTYKKRGQNMIQIWIVKKGYPHPKKGLS